MRISASRVSFHFSRSSVSPIRRLLKLRLAKMLLRSNTLLPCQQGLTVWLCPDRGTGEPVAIKTDGIATYGYIKKDDINLMGMGSHGWPR